MSDITLPDELKKKLLKTVNVHLLVTFLKKNIYINFTFTARFITLWNIEKTAEFHSTWMKAHGTLSKTLPGLCSI